MARRTMGERLTAVEYQLQRFIAEIESEKGTRSRRNKDFEMRIRNLERAVWTGFGAVAVLQILLKYIL